MTDPTPQPAADQDVEPDDRRSGSRWRKRAGHELRNPLSAITHVVALLRALPGDPRRERYLQILDRQVESLRGAVDELLGVDGDGLPPTPTETPEEPAGPPGAAPPSRVLVVEDNPDGRDALRDLLEIWGHQVALAMDGEGGVRLAVDERPTVALVDIDLPGIDGYEVARRIRREYPEAPPLLVAMTGFDQPEDRERAFAAGFDLHLVKPVPPRRLARLLRRPEGARDEAAGET